MNYIFKDDYYVVNPLPDIKFLNNYYNSHCHPITQEMLDESLRKYRSGNPSYKLNYYSKYIKKYSRIGDNYLDFGCGSGMLLYHNRDHYNLYGVETSNIARKHCEKLGIKMWKKLKDLKDDKFNIISAIDVIEHVCDPKQLLTQFKELLAPGGTIFLRLPVTNGITFNKRFPSMWKWACPPYHLSLFSIKAIRRLANECGLRCEVIYDETTHVTWDLVRVRLTGWFFMQNRLTRGLCRIIFYIIRRFLMSIFSSDTVFFVLRK